MNLKNISSKGNWCSYCAHQKLCENNDCSMCFNNSFVSVERSKYLHDKTISPRMLFKSTNKKYKFDCDVCNKVFSCQLSDITKGVWCSFCVNKTEKILFDKFLYSHVTPDEKLILRSFLFLDISDVKLIRFLRKFSIFLDILDQKSIKNFVKNISLISIIFNYFFLIEDQNNLLKSKIRIFFFSSSIHFCFFSVTFDCLHFLIFSYI